MATLQNLEFNNDSFGSVITIGQVRPFDSDGNGELDGIGYNFIEDKPISKCNDDSIFLDVWNCNQISKLSSDNPRGSIHGEFEYYEANIYFGSGEQANILFIIRSNTPPDFAELLLRTESQFGAMVSSTTGETGIPLGYDIEFALTNVNKSVQSPTHRVNPTVGVRASSNTIPGISDYTEMHVNYSGMDRIYFETELELDGDISDFFNSNGNPLRGVSVVIDSSIYPGPIIGSGLPSQLTIGLNDPFSSIHSTIDGIVHPSGFNQRALVHAYNPNLHNGTIYIGIDLPGGSDSLSNPSFTNNYGFANANSPVVPFDSDGNGHPDSIGNTFQGFPIYTCSPNILLSDLDVWNCSVDSFGASDNPRGASLIEEEFYKVFININGTNHIFCSLSQGNQTLSGITDFTISPTPIGAMVNTSTRLSGELLGHDVELAITNINSLITASTSMVSQSIAVLSGSTVSENSADSVQFGLVPNISKHPSNKKVSFGESVLLNVVAPGAIRFQWRLNGGNIFGATNSNYFIPFVTLEDGGTYTVVVANEYGAVTSDPAYILFNSISNFVHGIDYFTNAMILPVNQGITQGNNSTYSRENLEPKIPTISGGRSAWFRFLSETNGILTLSTKGSTIDTVIAGYSGSSISNLNFIDFDDDSDGNKTSSLYINVDKNTIYNISVDTFNSSGGNFILSWSFNPSEIPYPIIEQHPNSKVVQIGENATFSVFASGINIEYQWTFNNIVMPGETNSSAHYYK